MGQNSKKNCDKTKKKTSQKSRKAALRVGRLSRCRGDKKIVTKLKNSNCEKKPKNSNCDKTQKL